MNLVEGAHSTGREEFKSDQQVQHTGKGKRILLPHLRLTRQGKVH